MHSANTLATAFVPRLRQYALLFVTSLACFFTGSLHAQTPVKQINAGGPAVAPFAADNSFSAGNMFSSTAAINLTGVTNPAPQAVYQSVRWNASFNYTLGGLTAGSSYLVRLHFVELTFTAAGKRLFNVAINGTSALSKFDIFAAVGKNHGLVKEFTATAKSSGQIVVAFSQGGADNPSIAGIEVLTTTAGSFALTVSNGTGSGTYTAGTIVSIAANTPPAGQIFSGWTGGAAANFGNVASATTTYTTTAAAQTIVANYTAVGGPHLQVLSITPSNSNPAVGAAVSFTVDVNNPGTTGVAAGTTTRLVVGTTTLTQAATPAIPAGTTVSVTIPGTWTAVSGSTAITATADATNINETNNSLTTTIVSGIGAAVPYTRYEAEGGTMGGGATLKVSANFDEMNIASQASDQEYVELPSSGSYVEWTVTTSGDGVTMRFTMPDSSDGKGLNGSLDCYVNGSKVSTINLTSYYMWQYFTSGDPSDTPNGGKPAFAFDEVHWRLPSALHSGDKIRIQSTGATGLKYGVDFLEIESVPAAIGQPAGSVSVASYGASTTAADNLAAFKSAVKAALASSNKTLYIPAGTYKLSSMWVIGSTSSPVSKLTITGAGIWYTNIQFTNSAVAGGGCSIRLSATGTMDFSNMYLNSNLRSRYHENAIYKCFMDNFGVNSRFHDIWEDHFECGFWVADYAYTPCQVATGLVIENSRIRNNLADGVNFCNGTSNSTVQNCSIRNNGDDGLAVWPNNFHSAPMAVNDTFTHNTIEFNWRAGGIAFYGGSGHKATYNYLKDFFMCAGFHANGNFPGYHFENNAGITISDTTMVCCGTSYDAYSGELGAIDLAATGNGIKNFTFKNIDIIDSQRNAIDMGYGSSWSGVQYTSVNVNGTGLDGITASKYSTPHLGAGIFTYSSGSATFTTFTWSNCAGGETYNKGGFVLKFN